MKRRQSLAFDDAFLTGVPEIDTQHRNLVDLVNEAGNDLAGSANPKKLKQLAQELLSYAIYHFETEELLMAEYGYHRQTPADAEAHIRGHRAFSAQAVAIQEALQNQEFVDTEELLDFLVRWVTGHIMETDKKLARFILQRRAGEQRVR